MGLSSESSRLRVECTGSLFAAQNLFMQKQFSSANGSNLMHNIAQHRGKPPRRLDWNRSCLWSPGPRTLEPDLVHPNPALSKPVLHPLGPDLRWKSESRWDRMDQCHHGQRSA